MSKKDLSQLILWMLVCVPIFLSGWLSDATLPFVLVGLFLGLYLLVREGNCFSFSRANCLFGLVVIGMAALSVFSLSFMQSVPGILWWFAYFGLFLYGQGIFLEDEVVHGKDEKNSPKKLILFGKIFVLAAVAYGIDAVYWFVKIGLTVYPRLNSLIGLHNAYGGFLIMPFLLGLYFSFQAFNKTSLQTSESNSRFQKILWPIATAFLFANIILTLSRGTWLAIAVAIVIVGIVFREKCFSGKSHKKVFRVCAYIILATILLTGGIWFWARHTAARPTPAQNIAGIAAASQNPEIFPLETADENSFTSRLYYFRDALHTAIASPARLFEGFGSGTYANALRLYKTDPVFYSSDPHDIFLKILVENGLVVALIFFAFIIILFWKIYAMLRKMAQNKPIPPIYLIILTGLIAMFIHACMDADWTVPFIPIIFFIFAGALYGLLVWEQGSYSGEMATEMEMLTTKIIVGVIAIAAIAGVQIFRSINAREGGDYLYGNMDYPDAVFAYGDAISLDPYDSENWYGRSRAEFATGGEVRENDSAKSDILHAISLYPTDADYYSDLAKVAAAQKDLAVYENALENSIKYSPTDDLSDYSALVGALIQEKNDTEALAVMNRIVPIYTAYSQKVWFASDPNAATITANLKILAGYKTLIEKTADPVAMPE